jgi:alanine-glyoxylate transaminase/serine-glyoxylate transaminase/serine-pyruvate transaminase
MSFQNPVFIPGPTNMPETIRQACYMPTIDHRSQIFAKILHPVLDGIRRVLKSETFKTLSFHPQVPAAGKRHCPTA